MTKNDFVWRLAVPRRPDMKNSHFHEKWLFFVVCNVLGSTERLGLRSGIQNVCGSSVRTQSELAVSSGRAERRVAGSGVSRITIRHHRINRTMPGGDPEALEHHFTANGFVFLCSRPYTHTQHLTDFSELRPLMDTPKACRPVRGS